MNSKLNLAPHVDSETETESSKYAAKEYNRCTDKGKNTLKQEIYHFYFHLTHILEISSFEVPISRFFWAFFQHLQICMFWRLAGLNNTQATQKMGIHYCMDAQYYLIKKSYCNLFHCDTLVAIIPAKWYGCLANSVHDGLKSHV